MTSPARDCSCVERSPLLRSQAIETRLNLKRDSTNDSQTTTLQQRIICEFARRGNEIYETQIRPQVEEGNRGKIVAIDIETGAFEVADDTITATLEIAITTPRCINMVG